MVTSLKWIAWSVDAKPTDATLAKERPHRLLFELNPNPMLIFMWLSPRNLHSTWNSLLIRVARSLSAEWRNHPHVFDTQALHHFNKTSAQCCLCQLKHI
jgi:hypothetical protein